MIVFESRDRYSIVRFVNRAFTRRTGHAAADLHGSNWWALHAGRGNENSLSQLRDAMRCGRELQIQLHIRCSDDSWFWSDLQLTPLVDDGGKAQYYIAVLRDISQQRDQLDALLHNANHDVLTGLPNRRMLIEHFKFATAHARRSAQHFALALIDLDGFKQINDTLGHRAGDELLQLIGARLARSTRAEDTVVRLGGDEFVVLIQSSQCYGSAMSIDARIRSVIAQPMLIQGQQLSVSCSVGVSLCPLDGVDFEVLLEHADRRMYAQKLGNRPDRTALAAGEQMPPPRIRQRRSASVRRL